PGCDFMGDLTALVVNPDKDHRTAIVNSLKAISSSDTGSFPDIDVVTERDSMEHYDRSPITTGAGPTIAILDIPRNERSLAAIDDLRKRHPKAAIFLSGHGNDMEINPSTYSGIRNMNIQGCFNYDGTDQNSLRNIRRKLERELKIAL